MPERSDGDPVAIVGMACRLPGGIADPGGFWDLLAGGVDAVTAIGAERWPLDLFGIPRQGERGKSYTWKAGVVDGYDRFDPAFFGISPREASEIDPQQRLVLELAVEALEDAGQPRAILAGSETGVFLGVSSTDFAALRWTDPGSWNAYTGTGSALSICANRLSYCLDLRGPSLVVDTACSSSLVALHLAVTSLRRGESTAALVGGVNVLLTPYPFISFSQASMLSPDGRCKAFSGDGRGYVRAEGGVVMVLKPLSRARADGDTVYALIRATGVNQDGRTSGLSMPNVDAQRQLLNRIYAEARVDPTELAFVEAHGTGTAVGDPVEATAIGEALGRRRPPDQPLPIGSAKSNLGHLEPASGLVGLLKAVLSLSNGVVPPSLHCQSLNPHVDFAALNLHVIAAPLPLAANGHPLVAGVNSFGFGGTNAHAIIAAPACPDAAQPAALAPRRSRPVPLVLSAHDPETLAAMAERTAAFLEDHPEVDDDDVAFTRACRRDHLPHRLAVAACERSIRIARLRSLARRETGRGVVAGHAGSMPGKVALVFSGNGSQWHGMARDLLAGSALVRRVIARIDRRFRPLAGWSIAEEIVDGDAARFAATAVAQPLLFALQVAAAVALRRHGLSADAVVGHSVGEVAAACVAGALSLDDAVRVIAVRSSAQEQTRGEGLMVAIGASAEVTGRLLRDGFPDLEIAGFNSPKTTVVSGPAEPVRQLAAACAGRDLYARVLDLDYAFHSRAMGPVRDEVLAGLSTIRPRPARLRIASAVSGGIVAGEGLSASYWWQNIREPVRFAAAVAALAEAGLDTFIEVGPHPILQSALRECLRDHGTATTVLHTLSKQSADPLRLEEAALSAYVSGAPIAWGRLLPAGGRPVRLPAYPWRRDRHWPVTSPESSGTIDRPRPHPLLGYPVPHVARTWEMELDLDLQPGLADHRLFGTATFPAAGFAELALAAAVAVFGDEAGIDVCDLDIREPLILAEGVTRVLQVQLSDDRLAIRSRERFAALDDFSLHAEARLTMRTWAVASDRPAPGGAPGGGRSADRTGDPVAADRVYAIAEAMGLVYGPAFRRLTDIRVAGDSATGRLAKAPPLADGRFIVDPTSLDAAFHALIALLAARLDDSAAALPAFLPVRIGRLRLQQPAGEADRVRVHLDQVSERSVLASVELYDRNDSMLLRAEGCRLVRRDRVAVTRGPARYRTVTAPAEHPDGDALAAVLNPADLARAARSGITAALARRHSDGDGDGDGEDDAEAALLLDGFATEAALRAVRALPPCGAAADPEPGPADGASPATLDPWRRSLAADGLLDSFHAATADRAAGSDSDGGIDPGEIWRTLVAAHPDWSAEAILAGRAARALTGSRTPPTAAAASPATVEHLLGAGPGHASVRGAVVTLVRAVAAHWPGHRPLRVLDLGGGLAGPARPIVAALAPVSCDYVVADADDSALARARSRLADLPYVRFVAFPGAGDDADDSDGALAGCRFDLILSADLAHICSDPSRLLRRLRRMLETRGVLVLAHRRGDRFADLVFGTDPEWWQTDGRGRSPTTLLRAVRPWKVLLGDAGFMAPPVVVGGDGADDPATLIIAVNPAAGVAEGGDLDDDGGDEGVAADATAAPTRILAAAPGGRADAVAWALAALLAGAGETVLRTTVDALTDALDQIDDGPADIILLDGIEDPVDGDHPGDDALAAAVTACSRVLTTARTAAAGPAVSRVRVVTRRAMVLDADAADDPDAATSPLTAAAGAAAWGCVRVLMNERPDLDWTLIDVQSDDTVPELARRLAAELRGGDSEREILLTRRGRRVVRIEAQPQTPRPVSPGLTAAAFTLTATRPGSVDSLAWVAATPRPPAAGAVEVRVRAAGLNFRDMMLAMGLLPDDVIEDGLIGATLGMECAGEVVAVGAGVDDFRVGDPVICFAPRSFSDRVTVDAAAVLRKPEGVSFTAAVTIPVTFFTAAYALERLAAIAPGETVLIHGAAGGVGLAALQIAHARGARVIATAGTTEKRDVLRLLGLEAVLDSRSLAFADEVRRLTAGSGVDVVLNCLAGEAAERSLELLKPFGRFIELGKRDFAANTRIGVRPLRRNISYFAVDADAMLAQKPALARAILSDILDRLGNGTLRPLMHRVFAADDIRDAFRLMQQSNHIGKIVIDLSEPPAAIVPAAAMAPPLRLDPDGVYLVAGGLGGFGARCAGWLASRGARRLVLAGRRGLAEGPAADDIARLQQSGVEVRTVACDIADAAAVAALFADLAAAGAPVRGIVHAAMVLDDATADRIDDGQLRRVLAPKLAGALHLHRASLGLPVDLFVLFSSATTLFGNPGQAAYVAANMALEQLVRDRRRRGLPGVAVCWGPIGDAGYLADNAVVREHLASRLGGQPLTAAVALDALDAIIPGPDPVVAVLEVDWRTVRRSLPVLSRPTFARLVGHLDHLAEPVDAGDLRERLAAATPDEARDILRSLIAEQAAAILRLPLERFETARPLLELGMDSLMGMELSLGIEKSLGVPASALGLGERTSVDTLAASLAARLARGDGEAPGFDRDILPEVSSLIDRHIGADDGGVFDELVDAIDRADRNRS